MRWYASGGKRYYVIDVEGYAINPKAYYPASKPPTRSYSVLDRDNNHAEVGSFYCERGNREAVQRRRAYALAEKLNAEA